MKKMFQIYVSSFECKTNNGKHVARLYKFYANSDTEAKQKARKKFDEHNRHWKPESSYYSLREVSKVLQSGNFYQD